MQRSSLLLSHFMDIQKPNLAVLEIITYRFMKKDIVDLGAKQKGIRVKI